MQLRTFTTETLYLLHSIYMMNEKKQLSYQYKICAKYSSSHDGTDLMDDAL